MTRRHEQLEEVIRRTLQESLRKGIADPRVRGIVSVGHVKLAPDMADATAFVSAYPAENLDLVMHGLKSATPTFASGIGPSRQSATYPKTLV